MVFSLREILLGGELLKRIGEASGLVLNRVGLKGGLVGSDFEAGSLSGLVFHDLSPLSQYILSSVVVACS